MRAYWVAVGKHMGAATFDVLFVAAISMAPLLLGRLVPFVASPQTQSNYWAFLTNGQLAFFSMGSLASLLLICFRQKLPRRATMFFGPLSLACLLFLVTLVGIDPTLQKAMSWVGRAALYLYIGVVIMRIFAEAMKAVVPADALSAGAKASKKTQQGLADRMSGASS